jgi:hypothetical protein
MKIRPVGAEFFRADGQTDREDEANSRFSQFCESTLKQEDIKVIRTFAGSAQAYCRQ